DRAVPCRHLSPARNDRDKRPANHRRRNSRTEKSKNEVRRSRLRVAIEINPTNQETCDGCKYLRRDHGFGFRDKEGRLVVPDRAFCSLFCLSVIQPQKRKVFRPWKCRDAQMKARTK